MNFFRALWRFVLFVCIVTIIGYLTVHTNNIYVQLTTNQQAQQKDITNLLLSQASILAAPLLAENELDLLYQLSQSIAQEPFVKSVQFYDNDGIKLIDSDPEATDDIEDIENTEGIQNIEETQSENLYQETYVESPLMTQEIYSTPLVKSILHDNENLGFVKIDYIAKQTNFWTKKDYLNSVYQIYFSLAISFLCGGVFYHIFLRKLLTKKAPLLTKDAIKNKSPY